MGKINEKADFATFPVSVADNGKGIANIIGATGAGTSFAMPAYWIGRNLRVRAEGSAFKVSVSVGAKTLVFAQSSPPSAVVVTAGYPVGAGETMPDGIVPVGCTHFNYVAQGTGDLHFFVSEPEDVINQGPEAIA